MWIWACETWTQQVCQDWDKELQRAHGGVRKAAQEVRKVEGALKAVMEIKLKVKAQMKAMKTPRVRGVSGSHCRQWKVGYRRIAVGCSGP